MIRGRERGKTDKVMILIEEKVLWKIGRLVSLKDIIGKGLKWHL